MKNKRSQEELARREKIAQLLQLAEVTTIEGVQSLMRETIGEFFERGLMAELEEMLGYGRYQVGRKNTKNSRNGYSAKTLRTSFGNITLAIPRDRLGKFRPKILPKNSTAITRDMEEKIISMYAKGMTTGDIENHVRQLYHVNVSDSTVSRITDKVLPMAYAWQQRQLQPAYAIVYLDAVHFNVRNQGTVKKQAVYVAIGLDHQGQKEVLGMWVGENERASHWKKVLKNIKERGVEEISLLCTDNLKGFHQAISSVFPRAQIQICIIHQIRSTMKKVAQADKKAISRDLKPLYTAENEGCAKWKLAEFSEKWGKKYPRVVRSWQMNWEHFSTFYRFPAFVRPLIYTTNLIEGFNRQLRKFSKTRSIFPSDQSLLKLIFLAMEGIQADWQRESGDYFQKKSLVKEGTEGTFCEKRHKKRGYNPYLCPNM